MTRLLIEGGRVLDPARKLDAVRDVLIEEGKVKDVSPSLRKKLPDAGLEVISAKGLWVLPGLVDMHVHLREPGRSEDETIATGTAAAAAGGVTTVLAMPNTDPPVDSPERVRWVLDRAKETAVVNVLAAGAVSKGQRGEELAPLGSMADAGAVAFTDDGRPVATAQLMRRALEYARAFSLPVIDHCEEPGLSLGGCMHEGAASFRLGLRGIPSASETVTAMRDIELARLTGGKLHVAHVSCKETVEAIRRAKEDGLNVTGEACPHHFTLSDADIPAYDPNFKMNPPLRRKEDAQALIEGLADGTLDAISTDHAPHAAEKKALPFQDAPFGVIGLETLVPLSLALVRSGKLKPLRWAELVSSAPARLLGLKCKGTLKPGMDGDVTVVDPKAERVLAPPFKSKSANTPFIGWKLVGQAAATIVAGRIVHRLPAHSRERKPSTR